MKRGTLGRGLDSLIPQEEPVKSDGTASLGNSIINVDILDLVPNSHQPRKTFNQEQMDELGSSIKQNGIIQPILASKHGEKFMIIAGERRWRAASLAGLKQVPVIVRDIDGEQELASLAIIENLQREDLNPVEIAHAYKRLMNEFSYKQEDVASIVGKSRSGVTNTLRLLNLPSKALNAIEQSIISEGHGRALLAIDDTDTLLDTLNVVITKKLSVRDTEKLTHKINSKKDTKPLAKKERKPNLFVKDLGLDIEQAIGSKVNIKEGAKESGVIEIFYSDFEELERIASTLRDR